MASSALSLDFDLAVGGNRGLRSYAAGASRRHEVFGRLKLGYGARATLVTGGVELAPVKHDGPDRVTIDGARLAMINADIHASAKIAPRLEGGFNLDVAGFSFGAHENASFRRSSSDPARTVGASPGGGNLFLFGSNDRGSLNSEFYLAWQFSPSWSVRGGLAHLLTEYVIADDLGGATRRYRKFSNLAFAAVRWTPKNREKR